MSNYIFTDVTKIGRGGDSSAVDRRASDRKVTNPWCDSRIDNASLCCRKRHLTLISHSSQAVNNLWWPRLTKGLQNKIQLGFSALVLLDRRSVPGLHERINKTK